MPWLRRLAWLATAVLLLWAVAWLGVPPLLKWQAEERLTAMLGRAVTLGKVEFSPWSLRLAITDLAVAAAPGAPSPEPQLQIGAVRADLDLRSLLHLAPVFESLQIDAPRGRVTRTAAGRYDIDDLLLRLAPEPGAAPGEAQHLAIYNLQVRDGAFRFDDQPAGRAHRVADLRLTLPFVSNLAADVRVKVEPRLAFTLDGAAFDSGAQALPFAPERNGTLWLKVTGLDLASYAAYLPAAIAVRVQRGKLSVDLGFDFSAPEQGEARVGVRGAVAGEGLAVTAADGAPLVEADTLSLTLKDVQPLARKAMLGALRVDGLVVHLARGASGELRMPRLEGPAAPAARAAPAGSARNAAPAPATPAPATPVVADGAWQLGLDNLAVAGGRVILNDAAVRPASAFVLADLALDAQQVQLPMQAPAPFTLQAVLRPQDKPGVTLATVSLDGRASASAAEVNVGLASVSLAALAPYLGLAAEAKFSGTAAMRAKLAWAAPDGDTPQRLVVSIAELGLDRLKAGVAPGPGRGSDIVDIERATVTDAVVDLAAAKITVAAIEVKQPDVKLERSADGAWNVRALAGATPLAQDPRAAARAAASASWQVALQELRVDGGRVRWRDAAPAQRTHRAAGAVVRFDLDRLRLGLRDVRLDGARLVSQPQVALTARVATPGDVESQAPPGTLGWHGTFGLEPLSLSGVAHAERFPLHAVQAYVPSDLGLRLQRADAGFDGNVVVKQSGAEGLAVDADGEVLLSDVMLVAVPVAADEQLESPTDRELLSWQSFALKGMKFSQRPGAVPRLAVAEATLSDFFARLILTEAGRFNLRDVTERPAAATAALPASAAAPSVPAAPAAAAPPTQADALPIELDLGGLKLVAGRINYSDRFVKPNYSAALTDLDGQIGAYRSGSGEPAALQIDGRVAGTGRLEIAGKLKPGAVPRELDVTAKARDIELAPLSPYARKYAGYAIERGKLSVDVHYQIARDGRLEASHQLILNQLTFGERVDSPDATKLPVLLAVSLLKDADGVIDINLPVTGSLSDPQFSLGGVIWRVIVNLLTKAITAPFTLLAGGGGHDMSVVEFEPGTRAPTAPGAETMTKVAKALADRPALKITIAGEADPDGERDALRQAMLDARLAQEQRREALREPGKAADAAASAPITGEERARLVKAVYKATDLPGKPRNLIGMQADIPTEKMEAMLREQMSAGTEAMRELALQRGLVVRDALAAKGLATERLFLGAPKLRSDVKDGATGEGDRQASGAAIGARAAATTGATPSGGAWTPRAKLDLSTK